MTTKERLHRFVDQLTDDEARSAFALLDSQFAEPVPRPLPAFVGMLNTDDPDLAARSSEILRAEFGRS